MSLVSSRVPAVSSLVTTQAPDPSLQAQPGQDETVATPQVDTTPAPVLAPEDQNQINPQFQGPPAGSDSAAVAERPSQVSFVEQPLVRSGKPDKGNSIGEERPGTFAQLGMLAAMALAGPVAPSRAYDPILKRVSANSFLEKSPEEVLRQQKRPEQKVDTRLRSDEQPGQPPAPEAVAAYQPTPQPAQDPEPRPEQPELA